MKSLTIVTGNPNKLREWQSLVPSDFKLSSVDIDLDEIQSLDLTAIAKDKAKRAYSIVNKPVVVEDIAAELVELNGLPGPFIKYFEQNLGQDALFKLASKSGAKAIVTCTICYYDGKDAVIAQASVNGKVVASRGENGFGFDKVFILDGQSRTYAEMTPTEKGLISHRSKAIKILLARLTDTKSS
ncbi:MAG: non-canonical purine NTP pyrophosphatase [Candidatus Saccharimonadales bacterium]